MYARHGHQNQEKQTDRLIRWMQGKMLLLGALFACSLFAAGALADTYAARAERPPETSAGTAVTDAMSEPSTEPPTEPPTEPILRAAAAEGKKLVALTFDDGPHPAHTSALLDFLREQGVPATFFVLGCNAQDNPEIVQRAAREGHQVASHTFHHWDLTALSPQRLREELESCAALLELLTGNRPTVTRPPYGSHNQAVRAAADTPLVLWSVDPRDWCDRDADIVFRRVMDQVSDGGIVLLHDLYATSVEAAKRVVPALRAQGYVFVTVDQLLAARGGAGAGEVVIERP